MLLNKLQLQLQQLQQLRLFDNDSGSSSWCSLFNKDDGSNEGARDEMQQLLQ